jgi:hypothetical protein
MSFSAITLCVASQRVFIVVVIVYFVMTQSGNFWITLIYINTKVHPLKLQWQVYEHVTKFRSSINFKEMNRVEWLIYVSGRHGDK